jgi:hypothetical protein
LRKKLAEGGFRGIFSLLKFGEDDGALEDKEGLLGLYAVLQHPHAVYSPRVTLLASYAIEPTRLKKVLVTNGSTTCCSYCLLNRF